MAYSSARATLGGKDVRKTTRQTQAPKASRTPTEIGQTVPTSAKGQRQKAAALSRVSSGSSVSRVYTSSSTSSATSKAAAKAKAKARKIRSIQRERSRILRKLIKDDSDSLRALNKHEKDFWKRTTLSEKGKPYNESKWFKETWADVEREAQTKRAPKGSSVRAILGAGTIKKEKSVTKRLPKVYSRLWKKSGIPGRMPDVQVNAPALDVKAKGEKFKARAYVTGIGTKDAEVNLPKGIANALVKYGGDRSKRTLLHEFAHTKQSAETPWAIREGAADLFARRKAKQLGLDPGAQGGLYKDFRKRTRRQTTKGYQMRGQFEAEPSAHLKKKRGSTPGRRVKPYSSARALERDKAVRRGRKRDLTIEKPKIEGRKEKRVAKQLKRAANKSKPGLIRKLDRGFGPNETITAREAAILAEAQGLPGVTYAQIAKGESGLRPGVPNPDDATPSLWQMTPSVQSAETVAKWDQIASKHKGGYTNPVVAAKQAKVLAGEGTGISNYYGTGFVTDPDAHLPGGPVAARRKLRGNPKPIPKKVKTKAKRVLGEQKTKEIVKKAKKPQAPPAPKQKPGEWAGSEKAVLSVIPKGVRAEGRGDKRTPEENAAVGGATESDHLTTNRLAYAADLPDDDALAQKIAKRLGMASHTGTNEVIKDGYRYQLIWQDEGHYDHIHLGAEWVGEGLPPGTVAGGTVSSGGTPISSVTAGVTTGGTTTTPTATTSKAKKDKRRKARRIEGREKSRLIRELIANTAQTSTRSETELTTTPYAERVRDRGVEISL